MNAIAFRQLDKIKLIQALCAVSRRIPLLPLDKFADRLHDPHQTYSDVTLTWRESGQILINWGRGGEWNLYRKGQFEENVYHVLRQYTPENGYVIDVGANIGLHTLALSLLVGESGRVLALEPHPAAHERLLQNVALCPIYANIKVHNAAASDQNGTVTFYAPASGQVSSKGRLAPSDGWESLHIPAVTLDDLVHDWQHVDLIKCDVEGFELRVLYGAQQLLARHHPTLVIEYAPKLWQSAGYTYQQLYDFLTDFGYQLTWLPTYRRRGLIRPAPVKVGRDLPFPHTQAKYDLMALYRK